MHLQRDETKLTFSGLSIQCKGKKKLFPSVTHNSHSIISGLYIIIFNNWGIHKEEDCSKEWERSMDYECKQALNQLGQLNLKFTETRLG